MNRSAAVLAGLAASLAVAACGGTSLPEPPPCTPPTPTPVAQSTFAARVAYIRAAEAGEMQLAALLADFRQRYPEGRFYRSTAFREDWVRLAGATGCLVDDLVALDLPPEAPADELARDVELEALLAEYQRVFDRGTEAVRQRNTSEYRDFNREIDRVAVRLREWVDRGLN